VVWPRVLERFRRAVLGARLVLVRGRIQRAGDIVHLVADRLGALTGWLDLLPPDEVPAPPPGPVAFPSRHPRNVRTIPKSRDFR